MDTYFIETSDEEMTSWRSTVSSLVTAFFAWVAFSPELFQHWPWLISLSKFVALGGLVSLGLNTKDKQVHSTVSEVKAATVKVNENK